MKQLLISLLFVFILTATFTQNKKEVIIEVYSSTVGQTNPYRSGAPLIGGSINPNGNGYCNIGVNYIEPLNKWLGILGGMEFSNHKIKTTYWVDNPNYPEPSPTYENIQLFSFPINIQADFLKYFYARTGFMIDWETKNNSSYFNNQSGIGLNFEVGGKYEFKNHVTLFLSPFFQAHGIVLFHSEQHAYKINNEGINIGIGYKF